METQEADRDGKGRKLSREGKGRDKREGKGREGKGRTRPR